MPKPDGNEYAAGDGSLHLAGRKRDRQLSPLWRMRRKLSNLFRTFQAAKTTLSIPIRQLSLDAGRQMSQIYAIILALMHRAADAGD